MAMEDFNKEKDALQEKINDAEISVDLTELEKLNKEMEALEARKSTYESLIQKVEISDGQVKQVEGTGGNKEVLENKLADNTEEINQVKEELKEQSELVVPDGNIEYKIDPELKPGPASSLEKPEKVEDVENYLDTLKQRFDQIPAEYKAAVSVLLQNIQTQEEKDTINRILGINEPNSQESDSVREKILDKYKDINKEYIGNGDVDDVFQVIVEKHPETKSFYDAMQALRSEKNQLKMEKSQYDEALQLSQDPEALKGYFDFTGSDGMVRSRAQYRLEVAKKLIDLGVLDQEKVSQDFEKWVEKTKREDLGKWKPEEQEEEMNLFRSVYEKAMG